MLYMCVCVCGRVGELIGHFMLNNNNLFFFLNGKKKSTQLVP